MLCLCFQAQSPPPAKPGLYLLCGVEACVHRPELPLPTEKIILASVKNGVCFYEKSVFWFEKEMFPSEKRRGVEKSLPASYTSWICIFIVIICNSLPLFYQMEVYTVRMTSVLIVMMVSFNLHTKLVESLPI